MEIIPDIQADLINNDVPLSSILRKARVLASQLNNEDLASWVSKELDGYKNHKEIPDYRFLNTTVLGTWTNGYWKVENRGVQLSLIKDEHLKELLTKYPVLPGISSIEQFSKIDKNEHLLVSPDIVACVNSKLQEDGYSFSFLFYTIGAHNFKQILDTVRNRLLDFILKLDKSWNPKTKIVEQDEVSKLVNVVIYNLPMGKNLTLYDQREQHFQYQFNSAGKIDIDKVNGISELVGQIELLRAELKLAEKSRIVSKDIATKADSLLIEAKKEVKTNRPKKVVIIKKINNIKDLFKNIKEMAGFVSALIKIAEVIIKIIQ